MKQTQPPTCDSGQRRTRGTQCSNSPPEKNYILRCRRHCARRRRENDTTPKHHSKLTLRQLSSLGRRKRRTTVGRGATRDDNQFVAKTRYFSHTTRTVERVRHFNRPLLSPTFAKHRLTGPTKLQAPLPPTFCVGDMPIFNLRQARQLETPTNCEGGDEAYRKAMGH